MLNLKKKNTDSSFEKTKDKKASRVDRGFIQIMSLDKNHVFFPVLHFHEGDFNNFLAVLARYSEFGFFFVSFLFFFTDGNFILRTNTFFKNQIKIAEENCKG